jgi:YD repeat-containing protein
MKLRALFFILFLLPLLLFAQSKIMSQFLPAPNQAGQIRLPAAMNEQTRGWRINHQTFGTWTASTQSWNDRSGGFYHYGTDNSLQPDSVVYVLYNAQHVSSPANIADYFTWDPTQHLLLTVNEVNYVSHITYLDFWYQYDAQSRLLEGYEHQYNPGVGEVTYRTHVTYGTGSEYELVVSTNGSPYVKKTYTYDTQGRPITSLTAESSDSLTWEPTLKQYFSYQANDASTGSDFLINPAALISPVRANAICFTPAVRYNTVLEEELDAESQVWYQTYRTTFVYDEAGNISSITDELYNDFDGVYYNSLAVPFY